MDCTTYSDAERTEMGSMLAVMNQQQEQPAVTSALIT